MHECSHLWTSAQWVSKERETQTETETEASWWVYSWSSTLFKPRVFATCSQAVNHRSRGIEMSSLPQQVLARPQVHDVWLGVGTSGAGPRTYWSHHYEIATGLHHTMETAIPKGRLVRPIGATPDPARAGHARAKKTLTLVETQLAAMRHQVEEARTETIAADRAVNELNTSIFADAKVSSALQLPLQQQGLGCTDK